MCQTQGGRMIGLNGLDWNYQKIPISELIPNSKNPRTVTGSALEHLLGAMSRIGLFKPIICDYDMTVIGGNQRLRLLSEKLASDFKVMVSIATRPLTEAEKQEIVILDNETYGQWDMEMLANDYDYDVIKMTGVNLKITEIKNELPEKEDKNEIKDKTEFVIYVSCKDELEQNDLFNEFQIREIECKII